MKVSQIVKFLMELEDIELKNNFDDFEKDLMNIINRNIKEYQAADLVIDLCNEVFDNCVITSHIALLLFKNSVEKEEDLLMSLVYKVNEIQYDDDYYYYDEVRDSFSTLDNRKLELIKIRIVERLDFYFKNNYDTEDDYDNGEE